MCVCVNVCIYMLIYVCVGIFLYMYDHANMAANLHPLENPMHAPAVVILCSVLPVYTVFISVVFMEFRKHISIAKKQLRRCINKRYQHKNIF